MENSGLKLLEYTLFDRFISDRKEKVNALVIEATAEKDIEYSEYPEKVMESLGYPTLADLWYLPEKGPLCFLTTLKMPKEKDAEKIYNLMKEKYIDTRFYKGVYFDTTGRHSWERTWPVQVVLAEGDEKELEIPEAELVSRETLLFPR